VSNNIQNSYLKSINGGGKPHRAPITTEHPLVRTHPVTHLKSLNYNPLFVTGIKDLNDRESVHILNFLYDHLHSADDLTVRWKWTPKRTAIFGERPFFDPDISESLTEREERLRREEAGEVKLAVQEGKKNGDELNGAYSNDEQKLDFGNLM
jgi:sulfonate dioxygenase